MGIKNSKRTANDNTPAVKANYRALHETDLSEPLPNRQTKRPTEPVPTPFKTNKSALKSEPSTSLKLTIGCWIVACVTMAAVFMLGLATAPKAFASLSLLWLSLWNSYVSADHGHWRLSELSVVTALSGLLGIIITTVNYFGLNLTLTDGLLLMSVLPIMLGLILKSRICALASTCTALVWITLSFSGLEETRPLITLLPLVFAAQLFLATKIQSGLAITLSVITAYYWTFSIILTHWSADNLPLTFAAVALFAIGAAHHRSGKALEDTRLTGSLIHIHIGWLVAMLGAIGFQYFWLSPDGVQGSIATLSADGLSLWKTVILASLGVVFCSAMVRYKHSQISFMGIILLMAASAFLPMMLWIPSWPQSVIAGLPGLDATPTIGIFIGAAILASALGMAINGVRRYSPLMIGMGISALFVEAYLLMKPEFVTIDNAVIFVTGFLLALAVGASIAGTSLAHKAPAPRLKHS